MPTLYSLSRNIAQVLFCSFTFSYEALNLQSFVLSFNKNTSTTIVFNNCEVVYFTILEPLRGG